MNNLVLLFHSVDDRNLHSLKDLGNIRPEYFEAILRLIKTDFDIVDIDTLLRCVAGEQRSSGRLLALTFDDGPKSYAENAVPIMEGLNIPSSCFLITDCIGSQSVYWRYLYNYCIQSGFGKDLADLVSAEYSTPVSEEDLISFTRSNFSARKNETIVNKIFQDIVSEGDYRVRENRLFLSLEDVQRLRIKTGVTLGIHTRTHPVMRGLAEDEIRSEIGGSIQFYQQATKGGMPMLSIPFGRLFKDYDERVIAIARELSVKVILSAYGGDNPVGQPLYNIRRISVNEGMLKEGRNFVSNLKRLCSVPEYSDKEKRLYNLMNGSK